MEHLRQDIANARDIISLNAKTEFVGETDEYAKSVNRLIREKYSLSDELAILRKALSKLGIDYAELNEYNEFVEQCKVEARKEII